MSTDPDPAAALERAEAVLTAAVELAGPQAEVSVAVSQGVRALTRFAGSAIHQNVVEDVLDLRLTVTVDARTATVSRSGAGARPDGGPRDEDPAAGRRLVAAALEAARLRPADPDWPGLAPPAVVEPAGHGDAATVSATAADRASVVRDFVAAAEGLDCAGFCATRAVATALATSSGLRVADVVTSATVDGIARAPVPGDPTAPADGSGRASAIALDDLDGAACGALAAHLARAAAQDPVDAEPGSYAVVLGPGAVTDVVTWLVAAGLSGRAVAEGRSFARPGEEQLDPAITLSCHPDDWRVPVLPFDDEGTPRASYDLVLDGVVRGLAYDRREARRAGVASNGGALAHRYLTGGVAPVAILAPGTSPADELASGLERGLLVTDFWYTRVLDPRRLVVTGLTRNGVFLVEDGEVTRPVRNVRFTQSYAEALAPGAVLTVGGDAALADPDPIAIVVPSLALAAWQVTGNARG